MIPCLPCGATTRFVRLFGLFAAEGKGKPRQPSSATRHVDKRAAKALISSPRRRLDPLALGELTVCRSSENLLERLRDRQLRVRVAVLFRLDHQIIVCRPVVG